MPARRDNRRIPGPIFAMAADRPRVAMLPFVEIAERLPVGTPTDLVLQLAGHVSRLLHRGRGDPGTNWPSGPRTAAASPMTKPRVTRDAQVRIHQDPAPAIQQAPSPTRSGEACTPAAQRMLPASMRSPD